MGIQRERSRVRDQEMVFRNYSRRGNPAFPGGPYGDWTVSVDYLVPIRAEVEFHRDVVTPRRLLSRIKPWNPVSHAKATILCGNQQPFNSLRPDLSNYPGEQMVFTGLAQPFMWFGFPEQALAFGWGGPDLQSTDGLLPAGVAAFHSRRALNTVLSQIQETVSIANFVYELRTGIRSLLPRLAHGVSSLGSGWLWWNFAALPLVRDIMAMLRSVADVRKRLEYLKKVNGQTVTVNYRGRHSVPAQGGFEHFLDLLNLGYDWDPTLTFPHVIALDVPAWEEYELNLQCRVNYDLDLHGADAFLNAMCAALGLLNPAQIAWNAIPFSFVVDWFINIGEWLENNVDVAQPFTGTIRILGSNHSITRRVMLEHWALSDCFGSGHVYARTHIRAYHRRAGCFGGVIDTEGLTTLQQSLALALITQGLGSRPYTRLRRRRLT